MRARRRGGLPGWGVPAGGCGAAEVVLFGEAHEREPGVKERRLLPVPRSPRPPPGGWGLGCGGGRGLCGREPGGLAPRRAHARGATRDPHSRGLAPEGSITYLLVIWCFKRQVIAAGGLGDVPEAPAERLRHGGQA